MRPQKPKDYLNKNEQKIMNEQKCKQIKLKLLVTIEIIIKLTYHKQGIVCFLPYKILLFQCEKMMQTSELSE